MLIVLLTSEKIYKSSAYSPCQLCLRCSKRFLCAKIFWIEASSTPQKQVLTKVLFQFELLAPPSWRQWSVKEEKKVNTSAASRWEGGTGVCEVLLHRWRHRVSKVKLLSAGAKSSSSMMAPSTKPVNMKGEDDNLPTPTSVSAPSRWNECLRLPLDSERDTRKTGGGASPSESAINAYDCFCPLSSLRGNGFNEVACDWSGCCISPPLEHRPKKNTKTQHKRAALHNHSLQVVHWLPLPPPVLDLLVGPMWEKKGNLSDGLHDLLWPLRSRVQTEQLGSWQSAATRRKYSDQRSVTADYTRNPRRQAERAGGPISSAGKKAFPTGSQVRRHLKESHVSKWMQSNLDSWPRSRTPRWK